MFGPLTKNEQRWRDRRPTRLVRLIGLEKDADGRKTVFDILEFDADNPRHYTLRRAKKSLRQIVPDCEIIKQKIEAV